MADDLPRATVRCSRLDQRTRRRSEAGWKAMRE